MKNHSLVLRLTILASLLVTCQKAPLSKEQATSLPSSSKGRTILIDGSEQQQKSSNPDDIVLGAMLPNPYAHDNVLAAFNTIYPNQQRSSLTVTDLYVQFLPDSWEALNALQAAIDAFEGENNPIEENDPYLFNYPIHYEVVQQGIYHHDPAIAADQPSYHYAVVKPDFQVPAGVTAITLAELVHVPYNTYIMAEAFRRVGLPITMCKAR